MSAGRRGGGSNLIGDVLRSFSDHQRMWQTMSRLLTKDLKVINSAARRSADVDAVREGTVISCEKTCGRRAILDSKSKER